GPIVVALCGASAWVTREVIAKDEALQAARKELFEVKAELKKAHDQLSKYEGDEFHVGRPKIVPGTNVTALLRATNGKLSSLQFDDQVDDTDVNIGTRQFRNGTNICEVRVTQINTESVTLTGLRCWHPGHGP
ncbi:MAG TPA: hypothetical protein VEK73_03525, partial [Xanthobacteraceae bacterium]|nr:hypothetical protein [Xanthobacteraceae bacterium]